jgi:uncharacterized protein YjbJ (UPF0337 family)
MVKAMAMLPIVAAISGSSKPEMMSALEQKWTRPHKTGVCFSKVGGHVQKGKVRRNPGAGMKPDDLEPYDRIQKDGYMKVNCIKDAMFNAGDKFGPNKHDYKYGPTANVSIVHYTAHVPKEDREKMTPEVCFNFCRTIDDMGYFGILNGRDCYCEPYFKQMASDSSECDAVCEGDTTQMCGGKSKSNIWEMHMCNDGAQTLAEASFNAHQVKDALRDLVENSLKAAEGKQKLATKLQDAFGQAGDPAASNLMQKAKNAAGDLQHLAEDAEEAKEKLADMISDADDLTGFDYIQFTHDMDKDMGPLRTAVTDFMSESKIEKFMEFDTAKEGDDLLAKIKDFAPKANATLAELQQLYLLSEPVVSSELYMHSGNCHIDQETGCFRPHRTTDGNYYNAQQCDFEILKSDSKVEIKNLVSEGCCDGVTVNRQFFSGNHEGETITIEKAIGDITWYTDGSVIRSVGDFEVCVTPPEIKQGDDGLQYYPVMYFVDKKYVNVAQTCDGDLIGSPIYFKNYEGCAAACDAHNKECVAFAYFPTSEGEPNMCFLFSKLKSVQYYTGCDEDAVPKKEAASFLQVQSEEIAPLTEEPKLAMCSAKLSKFVGTNLKPDPSGKNDFKLKELTKADRCYELK